jgi:hypothetical protein
VLTQQEIKMTNPQKNDKSDKKQPLTTPKEKKAAKKLRKDAKEGINQPKPF